MFGHRDFNGHRQLEERMIPVLRDLIRKKKFIEIYMGRDFTIIIMFIISILFFLLTYFVTMPILNIICIVLAIMSSNGAAAILWSVYCPSLRDTGLVSGITGFLDFLSYSAAALASLLIPKLVSFVGWRNLLLTVIALMLCGVAICIPHFVVRKKNAVQE